MAIFTLQTGRQKILEDAELEALITEDLCQSQDELVQQLRVTW